MYIWTYVACPLPLHLNKRVFILGKKHTKKKPKGIAARGCYDLTQHQEASGKSMEYFDETNKGKYIPHVIEPSLGVDRLFLAIISSAYHEDEVSPFMVG